MCLLHSLEGQIYVLRIFLVAPVEIIRVRPSFSPNSLSGSNEIAATGLFRGRDSLLSEDFKKFALNQPRVPLLQFADFFKISSEAENG
jgi:hypothetical protein